MQWSDWKQSSMVRGKGNAEEFHSRISASWRSGWALLRSGWPELLLWGWCCLWVVVTCWVGLGGYILFQWIWHLGHCVHMDDLMGSMGDSLGPLAHEHASSFHFLPWLHPAWEAFCQWFDISSSPWWRNNGILNTWTHGVIMQKSELEGML
jgi:hypothetical protein